MSASLFAVVVGTSPAAKAGVSPSVGVRTVALTDTQAQGLEEGVEFRTFSAPSINDAGDVAFRTLLTGTGISVANNLAIITTSRTAGASVLARRGDQAPGFAPGTGYDGLSRPYLNNAGRILFDADVSNATNDSVIYTDADGAGLARIARSNIQVPGLPRGVTYAGFREEIGFNNAGEAIFTGGVSGAGINGTNRAAVVSSVGGSGLNAIARTGDQAPGIANGFVYTSFATPSANDAGQVMFRASVNGSGFIIFSDIGGAGIRPLFLPGGQAQGFGPDAQWTGFGDSSMNNLGDVSFVAGLTGDTAPAAAVYTDTGGDGFVPIASEGERAPGFEESARYTSGFFGTMVNDSGLTAFWASVDPGDGGDEISAIYAADASGEVRLIVAANQAINVSNDPALEDYRTISGIGFTFDLNNNSEIAFQAFFTDGSRGIFVATIPAPGAALLFGLAALAHARRRSV